MPKAPAPSRNARRLNAILGSAAIGLVLALAAPAPGALAQGNVVAENIRHSQPGIVIEIPRVEATGANVSAAELKAIFAGEGTQPVADRLARLDARAIRIPSLRLTQTAADQTTTTLYRDILLEDVRAGRIARATSPGGTISVETKAAAKAGKQGKDARDKGRAKAEPVTFAGTFGPTSFVGFDSGFLLRLYTQSATGSGNAAQTVYESFSTENIALTDGKGGEVRIARINGQAARAKLGALPWLRLPELVTEMEALDEDDDNGRLKVGLKLLGIFEDMEIGDTRIEGVVIRGLDTKDKSATVLLGSMSLNMPATGEGSFQMNGLDIAASDARIRIGSFGVRGFSLAPTMAALRDAAAKHGNDALDRLDAATLMPYPGSWSMRDVDIDVPAKEGSKSAERMRITLRGFEFTSDKPLKGVPTAGRLNIDSLRFPIPRRDPNFRDLAAMGYSAIDTSATLETDWNPRTKELELSNFSINGVDMGSINSRILLGNAMEGLFARDTAMNQIALVQLTFKAFDMRLQDKGLFGKVLTLMAGKQKTTADALRAEYGMAAAIAIPAMLGNTDSAKKVGAAVAQFIAKPGVLSISAKARNPAGLGLSDVGSLSNPAAILDALEIDARAE
jgi:hypothetical protein